MIFTVQIDLGWEFKKKHPANGSTELCEITQNADSPVSEKNAVSFIFLISVVAL